MKFKLDLKQNDIGRLKKITDEKYETNTRVDSLEATKTKVFHADARKASNSKFPMTIFIFISYFSAKSRKRKRKREMKEKQNTARIKNYTLRMFA